MAAGWQGSQATSGVTLPTCKHCGNYHNSACPRVKVVEYYTDGREKRVEYFPVAAPPVTPSTGAPARRAVLDDNTDRRNVLLTVDQTAAQLNCSARFVRRIIADGRMPAVRLGRHVRIRLQDLDSFVDNGAPIMR